MKLLIIPNFNTRYDVDMVGGLSRAFKDLGVESYFLRDTVFDHNLNDIAKSGSFDCIFRINKFRPKTLNENVRHISWFQDFDTIDRSSIQELKDGDIFYTTGDLKRLGISLKKSKTKILPLAVDVNIDRYNKIIKRPTSQYDFGLAGFIPILPLKKSIKELIRYQFANIIRSIPLLGNLFFIRILLNLISYRVPYPFIKTFMHVVEANYDPLSGSLDINDLEKKIFEVIKLSKSDKKKYEKNYNITFLHKFFFSNQNSNFSKYNLFNLALHESVAWSCRQYPRYLDRATIVKQCMEVSNKIALAGNNWDKYDHFKSMYKGSLNNIFQLIEFYNNCKINICNNTHGIGIAQTRILEIMMSGNFVLSHSSKYDGIEGGLLHYFENGKHLVLYDKDNFIDISQKWIKDSKGREMVSQKAYENIKKNHTWHNRAKKIINDLKK